MSHNLFQEYKVPNSDLVIRSEGTVKYSCAFDLVDRFVTYCYVESDSKFVYPEGYEIVVLLRESADGYSVEYYVVQNDSISELILFLSSTCYDGYRQVRYDRRDRLLSFILSKCGYKRMCIVVMDMSAQACVAPIALQLCLCRTYVTSTALFCRHVIRGEGEFASNRFAVSHVLCPSNYLYMTEDAFRELCCARKVLNADRRNVDCLPCNLPIFFLNDEDTYCLIEGECSSILYVKNSDDFILEVAADLITEEVDGFYTVIGPKESLQRLLEINSNLLRRSTDIFKTQCYKGDPTVKRDYMEKYKIPMENWDDEINRLVELFGVSNEKEVMENISQLL